MFAVFEASERFKNRPPLPLFFFFPISAFDNGGKYIHEYIKNTIIFVFFFQFVFVYNGFLVWSAVNREHVTLYFSRSNSCCEFVIITYCCKLHYIYSTRALERFSVTPLSAASGYCGNSETLLSLDKYKPRRIS